MKNITNIIPLLLVLLLSTSVAYAHGEETFAEAEELIESKVSCDDLTDDQLEVIGDYYMEQMHPGEAHEAMDEMMGGEGSEQLRLVHMNMAKKFYCGEHDAMGSGMMDMMMGRGMMGRGIASTQGGGMMGYGMMGSTGWGASLLGLIYWAIAAFVFSAIFWLTHNWLADTKHKKR